MIITPLCYIPPLVQRMISLCVYAISLIGVDKKEDVNASISMSYQTSSLFYLPHLRHHKDSLVANAYLGKGRSGGQCNNKAYNNKNITDYNYFVYF